MRSGAAPVRQPYSWKEATIGNINRIQQIFDADPTLTRKERIALYGIAHEMAAKMSASGSTEYWGIFINALRTLVAGQCAVDPKTLFE